MAYERDKIHRDPLPFHSIGILAQILPIEFDAEIRVRILEMVFARAQRRRK